jgi:hypothetical protein
LLQKLINKKTTFIFILLSFVLLRCANQLPPGGGEVDLIPPEIVEVYPEPGTVMFDDDYFEIDFSEYVDKRSVKEAIFISPYIEEGLEYEWTGKSLTATFKKGLAMLLIITIKTGWLNPIHFHFLQANRSIQKVFLEKCTIKNRKEF